MWNYNMWGVVSPIILMFREILVPCTSLKVLLCAFVHALVSELGFLQLAFYLVGSLPTFSFIHCDRFPLSFPKICVDLFQIIGFIKKTDFFDFPELLMYFEAPWEIGLGIARNNVGMCFWSCCSCFWNFGWPFVGRREGGCAISKNNYEAVAVVMVHDRSR